MNNRSRDVEVISSIASSGAVPSFATSAITGAVPSPSSVPGAITSSVAKNYWYPNLDGCQYYLY